MIPTRVLEFASDTNKGTLLGLVTVVGALVSMLTGPIAGVLSDESRLRWGRRRPFLAVGIAFNAVALLALIGAWPTQPQALQRGHLLALTLLPKGDESAKYMGIWGIAGTFPQVLAPGIGGVLLDAFNRLGPNWGYPAVFAAVVLYLVVGTAMLTKVAEPAHPVVAAESRDAA